MSFTCVCSSELRGEEFCRFIAISESGFSYDFFYTRYTYARLPEFAAFRRKEVADKKNILQVQNMSPNKQTSSHVYAFFSQAWKEKKCLHDTFESERCFAEVMRQPTLFFCCVLIFKKKSLHPLHQWFSNKSYPRTPIARGLPRLFCRIDKLHKLFYAITKHKNIA